MMSDPKSVILVVDDEESLRDSMRMLLTPDYNVVFAVNGKEAIKKAKQIRPDLVLCDIRLPEIDGLEVLRRLKEMDPELDVVMVTAMNTVQYAVEAIKLGAYDYITKPFDIAVISTLVEKILEKRRLKEENIFLKEQIGKQYQFEKIVGKSKPMRELFSVISEVAKNDSTILIQGESGTGKELVARAIHNKSPRANKLFVPINCASIPDHLIESELFGHERGAFTGAFERKLGKFEIAEGGTLFLDEIGSLPLALQGKLLRVLQEKEIERIGGVRPIPIDARIISATNANLQKAVNEDKFRKDLFYRLHVIPINIVPLRERREDIPILIDHFITIYNAEFNRKIRRVAKTAMQLFIQYDWPGNVRELQNIIERLVALGKRDLITLEKIPKEITGNFKELYLTKPDDINIKNASMRFEAAFIKKALEKSGGKKVGAARLMGIHRNTLLQMERKLKKYL